MSDPASARHLPRRFWMLAALFAIAIHAGGVALAFAFTRAEEAERDLGAPAIEIGIELTAARKIETGLPVGPDSEASIASPAMVEQQKVLEQTELPKDAPTETDDPDRVVTPNETKPPKDDDPKPASQESHASRQTVAAEETAAPAIEDTVQSIRPVSPAPGTGASAQRDLVTWQKELAAHFNKYKNYPADRAQRNAEVLVSFVLDPAGHIVTASIAKGSGDPAFDDAALAMLQRADPVPSPPAHIAGQGLAFSLPVVFHVKGRK